MTFAPRPVQQPHPPIWVAGDSDRALRRAAELGDAWQPELAFDELERAARRFFELAAAGGRLPSLALGRRLVLTTEALGPDRDPVHGSPEQVAADLRRYVQMGVSHFVFGVYRRTSSEVIRDLETFASRVRPGV